MDSKEREQSVQTANDPVIYMTIGVGIVICMVGVFLRFAYDAMWLSLISWAILAVGAVVSILGVFKILNAK